MMKIALIGYGKMGKTIEGIALQRNHSISLIIDAENRNSFTKENLQLCDVAIEFTGPDSAKEDFRKRATSTPDLLLAVAVIGVRWRRPRQFGGGRGRSGDYT